MCLKNFWFSYKNILTNELNRKNYFSFIRKIFGVFYKFILKLIRNNFSKKIIDLDKIDHKKYSELDLDELFINFNCDKGSKCIFEEKRITSHHYSNFYQKYFSSIKNDKMNILELGSHEGKGIASFYFYFPNSSFFSLSNRA